MQIFNEKVSGDFESDVGLMDDILRPNKSFDIIRKTMKISDANIVMYYIDGFIKGETLQKLLTYIVSVKDFGDKSKGSAQRFADMHVPAAEVDVTDSIGNAHLEHRHDKAKDTLPRACYKISQRRKEHKNRYRAVLHGRTC